MIEVTNQNETYSKWFSDKWYNHNKFSLIPVLHLIKADLHSTSRFNFRWLFLEMWSRDSFDFELAFVISTHWGIGITMLLPYLRIKFTVPCTEKIDMFVSKYLDRKPLILKQQ